MLTATAPSHQRKHELLDENIHVMHGDIEWIREYFTPDDDGSDRFTRIEGRLEKIEAGQQEILSKLEALNAT